MFSLKGKSILALFLSWGSLWLAQSTAQQPDKGSSPERLQGLWNDLASEEESKASRALLALTATPKETVAFLQKHLQPIKVDAERVAKLVAELDDARFPKREAAAKELEYLGKFAHPLLEKHLKENKSAEVQKRLRELISRIPADPSDPATAKAPPPAPPLQGRSIGVSNNNGQITLIIDGQKFDLSRLTAPTQPVVIRPYAGWQCANRAVALLEHLATPEARQLLQTMVQGERDAPPTKAAREALERLGK